MALFYLIFAVVLIPLIIIGIIGLVIGIILLIVGLSSRKSVKHQGKLFPKVFIVLGTILVCIPVLTVGTAVTVGVVSNINGGGSLPERWRNTWIISENTGWQYRDMKNVNDKMCHTVAAAADRRRSRAGCPRD